MEAPRSLLYVPAGRMRLLGKIPELRADVVVVDLEDGVPAAAKAAARDHVRQAHDGGLLPQGRWMLRVNAPAVDPRNHAADISLAVALQAPVVVLPKAESCAEVEAAAATVAAWSGGLALTIETASGVRRCGELAAAGPVAALILGSADLRLSLGARPDPERRWELLALQQILLAARERGCAALDSVYFRFRDGDGLRRHACIARDLGYDGKSCIHPAQIDPVHEVYASSPEEIAWARRVVAAWESGDGEGRGVIEVEGEMIERLHLGVAARILKRAGGPA